MTIALGYRLDEARTLVKTLRLSIPDACARTGAHPGQLRSMLEAEQDRDRARWDRLGASKESAPNV